MAANDDEEEEEDHGEDDGQDERQDGSAVPREPDYVRETCTCRTY